MDISKLFSQVLMLSLIGSILSLSILLIKAVFKQRLSAKLHYFIWIFLILRLIVPFNFQSRLSLQNIIPADNNNFSIAAYVEQNYSSVANLQQKNTNIVSSEAVKEGGTEQKLETNNWYYYFKIASVIWGIGILAILSYICFINIMLLMQLKKSETAEESSVTMTLESVKKRLKVGSKVRVVYNEKFKSPAVYGLMGPKIIISKELVNRLTVEELEFVFLHELTHIKRKDFLINIFLILIQTVYWFNPLIWYSIYQIKQDCELACDADALKVLKSEEIRQYGQTIINMLRLITPTSLTSGVLGFASKNSKRRIIMITKYKKTSISYAVLALVLTFMVGCSSTIKAPESPAEASNTKNNASTVSDSSTNNQSNDSTAGTSDNSDSSSIPVNNSSSVSVSTQDTSQNVLLKSIMNLAKQGKIINSTFPVKTSVIEDIEKKLGKPDNVQWISSAKGNYATFSKYNVVFAFNKGSQIFEARSFDNRLSKITLSMVKNQYGNPAYSTKYNNQQIIGYVASKDYKVLLVFSSNGGNDPKLDHYSVLYPRGTVNNMADDPGRQW